MFKKVLRLLRNEDGPTAVEYAVLLALLVGAMLAGIVYLGTEASATWRDSADALHQNLGP